MRYFTPAEQFNVSSNPSRRSGWEGFGVNSGLVGTAAAGAKPEDGEASLGSFPLTGAARKVPSELVVVIVFWVFEAPPLSIRYQNHCRRSLS